MPLVSGNNYVFYNKQAGTALDLDVGSNNVQGWTYHEGRNQQWNVVSHASEGGSYWTIQNVETGTFLAYQSPAQDGMRVVCTPQPYSWGLWQDSESGDGFYTISVLHSQECVDLADGGNGADGTPVQLWTSGGGDNQKWGAQEA